MDDRLPLPALLSHALVAFTIECDNEFERQMPHSTTDYGRGNLNLIARFRFAPWLTSLAMWFNCLRFVNEQGITVRELERLARTSTNLDGMRRWGYIGFTPDLKNSKSRQPRPDWLIHPTPAGSMARKVWQPMCGLIEDRWRERFGSAVVEHLRESLSVLTQQFDPGLPDCMPLLGYGLFSMRQDTPRAAKQSTAKLTDEEISALPLPALLARSLLAFAIAYETKSKISLAIGSNVLRLFEERPMLVRDLPRLSAVSKEAIVAAVGYLERHGYAVIGPESPGSRNKAVTLNSEGLRAKDKYQQLVWTIEQRWQEQFSDQSIVQARQALESLAGNPESRSLLMQGMKPYPEGWRTKIPQPEGLPHFPMVSHRGGFPDGS